MDSSKNFNKFYRALTFSKNMNCIVLVSCSDRVSWSCMHPISKPMELQTVITFLLNNVF